MRSIRVVALLALLVAMAAPAAAEGPIKLSKGTWAGYQEYLAKIGSTGRGIFAVAPDGYGFGYSFCEAEKCTPKYQKVALDKCVEANPGFECVIFAIDREPQMEFVAPE